MNIAPYRAKLPDLPLPEKRHGGVPDSSVGNVPTHGEKTVEVTFHTCVYKKSLRNFFKSGGFNQNGGYLSPL